MYANRARIGRVANHGQQLAHPGSLGLHRQLGQQFPAQAHAAGFLGHVDGVFGRKAVGRTWLEPVGIGKTQHLAVFFGHQPRQATRQHIGTAAGHVGFRWRIYFKGARAVEHMVLVNGGNCSDVAVSAGADIGHVREKRI
ncbi:hypothetical protein D3C71_1832120 [compost metagenome]